jgi:Domain of unknown function (DUF4351)
MKGSVIYDQIFQEGEQRGEQRGKRDMVVKLLTRRVGVLSAEMLGRIEGLSLERVEDLGVALLDFSSVDDLVGWVKGFWVLWKKPKETPSAFWFDFKLPSYHWTWKSLTVRAGVPWTTANWLPLPKPAVAPSAL